MLLETFNLTKLYAQLPALVDCNLSLDTGEVFGLLGPNGAGKSTLLRLILGFLTPSSGSARVMDLDCHLHSLQVRRQISFLPGEVRLFPSMRSRTFLRFIADLRRDADLYQRGVMLAERLELDLSRRISCMSTGMRQKLALAATFAAEVPLLILDEPTSNLDPAMRREVGSLVREARNAGRSVMFSSHVLSEVEENCDRVAVLKRGRVAGNLVLAEIRKQHRIEGRVSGALPPLDPALSQAVVIQSAEDGHLIVDVKDSLSRALGWLGQLSWKELRIEPVGLRSIYDTLQGPEADESTSTSEAAA